MASITSITAAPVLSTMFSKDKGSFGNKVDCSKDHLVNNIKCTAAGAGTLLVGGGAAAAVSKAAPSFASGLNYNINEFIKKVAKTMEYPYTSTVKGGKVSKFIHKNLLKLSKTSGKTKALGAIAIATLGVLSLIKSKHNFKAGQIDQKYTDRANAQVIAK